MSIRAIPRFESWACSNRKITTSLMENCAGKFELKEFYGKFLLGEAGLMGEGFRERAGFFEQGEQFGVFGLVGGSSGLCGA